MLLDIAPSEFFINTIVRHPQFENLYLPENLQNMEEYCWLYYYIYLPKTKTELLISFYMPALKMKCKFGHIDTLNSKVFQLLKIVTE